MDFGGKSPKKNQSFFDVCEVISDLSCSFGGGVKLKYKIRSGLFQILCEILELRKFLFCSLEEISLELIIASVIFHFSSWRG